MDGWQIFQIATMIFVLVAILVVAIRYGAIGFIFELILNILSAIFNGGSSSGGFGGGDSGGGGSNDDW